MGSVEDEAKKLRRPPQVSYCTTAAIQKLLGNLTGVVFETVEGHLSILADLDEVTVGITHVAAPFPAVIV